MILLLTPGKQQNLLQCTNITTCVNSFLFSVLKINRGLTHNRPMLYVELSLPDPLWIPTRFLETQWSTLFPINNTLYSLVVCNMLLCNPSFYVPLSQSTINSLRMVTISLILASLCNKAYFLTNWWVNYFRNTSNMWSQSSYN